MNCLICTHPIESPDKRITTHRGDCQREYKRRVSLARGAALHEKKRLDSTFSPPEGFHQTVNKGKAVKTCYLCGDPCRKYSCAECLLSVQQRICETLVSAMRKMA